MNIKTSVLEIQRPIVLVEDVTFDTGCASLLSHTHGRIASLGLILSQMKSAANPKHNAFTRWRDI